jgi:glucokinase
VVAGVDVGATHSRVVLCTIANVQLAERHRATPAVGTPEECLGWAVGAVHECLKELELDRGALTGLGIGLPARVNFSTGQPLKPNLMPGWDGYDVPGYFRERVTSSVLADNDVNVLALNERATFWPDVADLIYVKVGTGLGGAVIAGGNVQRGASGTAGDIGHMRLHGHAEAASYTGRTVLLGDVVSGNGMAAALEREGFETSSVNDILELVRLAEPRVLEHMRTAGQALGEALADVVDMLNPAVVVLGGRLGTEGEHLLAGVRDAVYRLSLPAATQDLQIARSHAGVSGAAMGACRLILDHILSPGVVSAAVSGEN